jgi:GT2 family glycosyltransferase
MYSLSESEAEFNWKNYCFHNFLSPYSTKITALEHQLESLSKNANTKINALHSKCEPFWLSYNHNKNFAIFNHSVPTPDIDSGSNRLYEILKILIDLKYNIYYITHDLIPKNPEYVKNLYNIGIKSVIGINKEKDIYCDSIYESLIKDGINFDICMFCFYNMFDNYHEKILSITPSVKTILDSVDVHWLRLSRGSIGNKKEKNIEKKCYEKADVVFAVTENDRAEILSECNNANVKILSNIHTMLNCKPNYENKNLVFVGGSNHTPNIDASIKAIVAYKNFLKKNPSHKNSKLFLVGKKFDNKTIALSNQCPSIKILGHLNNSELDDLYKNNTYAILAPITWGAGIKGKICQGISYNLPIITTDIGNEGIDLVDGESGFIGNSDHDIESKIKQCLETDKKSLYKMTSNAQHRLKKMLGKDSAKQVLEHTIQTKQIIISIATYNNALLLERCVNSLLANTNYPNYKIHIVSNGCKDGTIEILKKLQKIYGKNKISFHKNEKNKHFILAHNQTIDKYKNNDILLINNDMEFIDANWLNHIYSSAYASSNIGCAGGKTLDYNYKVSEFGACLFNDGYGINIGRGLDYDDEALNNIKYTGYVSGCLMYMKRSVINELGKLDTRYYPCYYEDSDWQYNLHINGYKTIVNPNCKVLHMEGGSESSTNISEFKKKCMESNKVKFLSKYKKYNIEMYNK